MFDTITRPQLPRLPTIGVHRVRPHIGTFRDRLGESLRLAATAFLFGHHPWDATRSEYPESAGASDAENATLNQRRSRSSPTEIRWDLVLAEHYGGRRRTR
jgi:hypothetical protein